MKLTNQKAFDKIYKYFIFKKNKQAVNDAGNCKFREGESRCAVGVLIPNKKYNVLMEEQTIDSIREDYFYEEWSVLSLSLLRALQNAHDVSNNWRKGLLTKTSHKRVAKSYSLTITKEPK